MDEKKKQKEAEQPKWEYQADQGSAPEAEQNQAPITWTASMHAAAEKSSMWYVLFVCGMVAAAAGTYWVTSDVLPTVAVVVVAAAAGFFSGHTPPPKDYKLTATSIKTGHKTHKLEKFKSFSIVEEAEGKSIWLKPIKRFAPFLIVYFPPEQEDSITAVLSSVLPNEPREPDNIDKLTKKLKL